MHTQFLSSWFSVLQLLQLG